MRYYYTLLHNRMCVVEFDIHILTLYLEGCNQLHIMRNIYK